VREIPRAGVLLLGNHIRVTLRTNTRCGKSNIPHTPTRPSIKPTTHHPIHCTRPHPAQDRAGGFLVSNIYLSKILVVNASLLKLLAKLLTNQPDTSCSTKQTPSRCKLLPKITLSSLGPWTGRSYPGYRMNCPRRDGP
jgi:hypothetical protein